MAGIDAEHMKKVRKRLQWILSPTWFGLFLLALGILSWYYIPELVTTDEIVEDGEIKFVERTLFSPGWMISLLLLLYYGFSFRFLNPVKSNEMGVKSAIERPYDEVASGPPFAPLLVVGVQTLNINFDQKEFPTEPELIWRPSDEQMGSTPPEGFQPPVRITFSDAVDEKGARDLLGSIEGQEKPDGSGDVYTRQDDYANEQTYYHWADREPGTEVDSADRLHTFVTGDQSEGKNEDGLDRRVTAEVSFVFRWRVIREKGIDFIENIGTVDNLVKQAEDEMVGILQRLLPNMSVGQALKNIALINSILRYKLRAKTAEWGVEVSDAYLKQIQFHRALNEAIADRTEAFYEAAAAKERLIREGEGTATAAAELERQVLDARAKGYKNIAITIDVTGAEVQAAETGRAIGEGDGTIVIGTEGFKDLVGVGQAISGLKPKKGGDS